MHRFAASVVLLLALSACGEKVDPVQQSTDVVEDIPPTASVGAGTSSL